MPSPRASYPTNKNLRSKSFNGRVPSSATDELKRPRTVPNLLVDTSSAGGIGSGSVVTTIKILTKVLINVKIEGSVGAVQVLVSLDNSVSDLLTCVLKQYIKEGRRPLVFFKDLLDFDLHYSQFALHCLDREEKLATLGSRNFFMCKRRKDDAPVDDIAGGCNIGDGTTASRTCSKQAEKAAKLSSFFPWLKFMGFSF